MARWVRLTSLCISKPEAGNNYVEEALNKAFFYIDRAGRDRPDLILLPEQFFTARGSEEAERADGPIIEAIRRKAKEHRSYIFCPLLERHRGRCYNSLVLLDRKGDISGIYRKKHPVICEIRYSGITPGVNVPVFKTDFARLGAAICYDFNFRDVPEALHRGRAEVVAFSSAWRAGLFIQMWALLYQFFIISAYPGELGMIVDPLGRVIARSWKNSIKAPHDGMLSRRINLDSIVLHCDYNEYKLEAIKAKYGPAVEIDAEEVERRFLLISHHPKKSALDIKREFHLESQDDFFARANRWRERALREKRRPKTPKAVGKEKP